MQKKKKKTSHTEVHITEISQYFKNFKSQTLLRCKRIISKMPLQLKY